MAEYERDTNLNTPEYWDKVWAKPGKIGRSAAHVADWIADRIAGLEKRRVVEYGFGNLLLAEKVGADRWEGRELSAQAVKNARAEGYSAYVTRCGDSPGYRKAYLVARSVLEHLDHDEMIAFLDKSRNAPHAFFSVPIANEAVDIGKHMRGWDREVDFREFLLKWWPYVEVGVSGTGGSRRLVAHCSRTLPEVSPILTIGTSTLLDFYGAHWTFKALMTYFGTFDGRIEYVLVDNHPEPTTRFRGVRGIACEECKRIGKDGPVCNTCKKNVEDMQEIALEQGARHIRWSEKQGTYPGKNQLQVEARGKWVLTIDSHVLLTSHALDTMLGLIESDPECDDFFHLPCLFRSSNPTRPGAGVAIDYRNQQFIYHNGKKRGGTYGWTGHAKTPGEPYPIAAMITSCYLVRRAAWFSAKGYDPILGCYGGWEGPLQLKWWMMGRRVCQIRHTTQERLDATPEGFLYHEHQFCKPGKRLANKTGLVHGGKQKQRNFAASSAVIGGEWWVRRHCELKGWDFHSQHIQEGLSAGLKLRPWMVSQLARPEWEDIRVFFKWMRDEAKVPGALKEW